MRGKGAVNYSIRGKLYVIFSCVYFGAFAFILPEKLPGTSACMNLPTSMYVRMYIHTYLSAWV